MATPTFHLQTWTPTGTDTATFTIAVMGLGETAIAEGRVTMVPDAKEGVRFVITGMGFLNEAVAAHLAEHRRSRIGG